VSEGFFPGGGGKSGFSWRKQKYFSSGGKSGKISFHPLKTTKTAYFAKKRNRKMSYFKFQGRSKPPLPPLPTSMSAGVVHKYRCTEKQDRRI